MPLWLLLGQGKGMKRLDREYGSQPCGSTAPWSCSVKVTNGFGSDWGAQIYAGYRSVTGTARLSGKSALVAIRELVDAGLSSLDQRGDCQPVSNYDTLVNIAFMLKYY